MSEDAKSLKLLITIELVQGSVYLECSCCIMQERHIHIVKVPWEKQWSSWDWCAPIPTDIRMHQVSQISMQDYAAEEQNEP